MHKDYFFIKLEIYPYLILVSRQDEDALAKTLKKFLPNELIFGNHASNHTGRATIFGNGYGLVLIHFNTLTPGTVAHESFHAVHFILEECGMSLSLESVEAYTYLLEYVVDKITNWVAKYEESEEVAPGNQIPESADCIQNAEQERTN